ncbi:MAG: ATP-binding protein, partial [Symploca sp. SIO3E6]|nr:ATP-binding protein [Caldora sp. SIO3E6]
LENFRGFKSFELQQLGRVNLLVGVNNSGKTSILEAIQLLCSPANLEPLHEVMIERGECFWGDDNVTLELDIRHLFYGHEIEENNTFSILGKNNHLRQKLVASIAIGSIDSLYRLNSHSEAENSSSASVGKLSDDLVRLGFTAQWTSGNKQEYWEQPLSSNGCLHNDDVHLWPISRKRRAMQRPIPKTQLIRSSSLTIETMTELFEQVVLTAEEQLVYEALQTIEPRIERIAPVSSRKSISSNSRGGFVVRLSGSEQRVPIGSLGDGIWRMLGLALAIVSVKGGVLLVDEIDTGLHFSTLSDMWKLIWETAKKLDVQVFATTHNSDCWTSLATIASQEDAAVDGITIQRIEPDKNTSVVFTEKEIAIAAERGIEVR